ILEKPRDAKIMLAKSIVKQFHSDKIALEEEENFINQFSKKQIPTDNPEIKLSGNEALYKELCEVGAFPSNSEARRIFQSGGATELRGEKKIVLTLESTAKDLQPGSVLKVGKR